MCPSSRPEATSTAARGYFDVPFYVNQANWTMPASSKLLLEAGYTPFRYNPIFGHPPPDGITNLITVSEQSNVINPATGLRYAPQPNDLYRAVGSWGWAVGKTDGWFATASYVTGAHSMKVGNQGNRLDQLDQTISSQPLLSYRFNQGVPNAVSYRLSDFGRRTITTLTGIGTTTIQLTDNSNKLWVDNRRTQLDMRFAKILRFGRTRSDIGIDLNNLLNTNYATGHNTTYICNTDNTPRAGGWGVPTSISTPRFVRINYTIDF